jgi:uroporphyrin-III C-methyltransferase
MTVHLVGAGPGDPDLLTLRAARLLRAADIVVYDRLVGDGVLALVGPGTRRFNVGKTPWSGVCVTQAEISALLVCLARSEPDATIVRVKGGDPFLFGRGGEEALALRAAGVAYEVVPGVSSALAAPAAAGIPVTHRGVAAHVTIVAGHRAPAAAHTGAAAGETDWSALARVGGTLVVLMGVEHRAAIADRLLAAGMPGSTSVAIVQDATRPTQHCARVTLETLGSSPAVAPAVLVIGEVAALDVTAPCEIARQSSGTAASGTTVPRSDQSIGERSISERSISDALDLFAAHVRAAAVIDA